MKKLILVLVFVFATGTMVNANSSSTLNEAIEVEAAATDCGELAFNVQDALEQAGMGMEDANAVADAVYIICEALT